MRVNTKLAGVKSVFCRTDERVAAFENFTIEKFHEQPRNLAQNMARSFYRSEKKVMHDRGHDSFFRGTVHKWVGPRREILEKRTLYGTKNDEYSF